MLCTCGAKAEAAEEDDADARLENEAAAARQRMADLFYAMDTDLNGMLDVEEFREAMRQVGSGASPLRPYLYEDTQIFRRKAPQKVAPFCPALSVPGVWRGLVWQSGHAWSSPCNQLCCNRLPASACPCLRAARFPATAHRAAPL